MQYLLLFLHSYISNEDYEDYGDYGDYGDYEDYGDYGADIKLFYIYLFKRSSTITIVVERVNYEKPLPVYENA